MPLFPFTLRPFERHHCTNRKGIGEGLRAVPAYFEGSALETIIISHYYFGATWIFEGDIGEPAEGISPDMICSRNNEFTELPNQVVIVRVGHVTRIWIDGHNAQAVRAASIVRAMIGFKRNVPEFHRFGPVLRRLHQYISGADGSYTRSCRAFCF